MSAAASGARLFPADDVVACGRRTVIRRKRIDEAAAEYRWRSDPEMARYDASRPVQVPFEDYRRNWAFDYRFTDMPGRSFAIEDENGRHIGNVMYYNIDKARGEAEIGISIGEREFWSQGYGSDALAAMARHLFEATALNRLYLHTLDWNERAQRGFRKAGFSSRGTSWRDGHTFVIMEVWRQAVAAEAPRQAVAS